MLRTTLARLLGEVAVSAGKAGTFLGERYQRIARDRWKREGRQWKAWVVWLDNRGISGERVQQGWPPVTVLRAARSDVKV